MGRWRPWRARHCACKSNLWTLYSFKFKRHFSAGHGEHGSKNRSSGAQGEDIFVDVPLGTLIKNTETDEIITEITEKGQEVVLLEGGLGRGNWHFKSPTSNPTLR